MPNERVNRRLMAIRFCFSACQAALQVDSLPTGALVDVSIDADADGVR